MTRTRRRAPAPTSTRVRRRANTTRATTPVADIRTLRRHRSEESRAKMVVRRRRLDVPTSPTLAALTRESQPDTAKEAMMDYLDVALFAKDLTTLRNEIPLEELVSDPEDPGAVAEYWSRFSFEVAVMCDTGRLARGGYTPPPVGNDTSKRLGWAIAFKGAGHDCMVSRRWLEHGPWRLLRAPNDTTLVQFYDLAADVETAIAQARPGHAALVAGFLPFSHKYPSLLGLYTDGLLQVPALASNVASYEMTNACATRRDYRLAPREPILNIAFVFQDMASAKMNLHELWLRELECRCLENGTLHRLDEDYTPRTRTPAWVAALL